jgi:hypothetical protein
MFIYVAKIYDKIIENDLLYKKSIEYIPEFLRAHGSEVLNWMTLIYDQKEAERYIREEGIEEGIVNILRSLINDNYPMSAILNLAGKHGMSDETISQLITEEMTE